MEKKFKDRELEMAQMQNKQAGLDLRITDPPIADIRRESEGEYTIPTSTVFGLTKEEIKQLQSHGFKIEDNDTRQEGVEVQGSSPFKLMRVLCSKFGWTTDGEVVSSP